MHAVNQSFRPSVQLYTASMGSDPSGAELDALSFDGDRAVVAPGLNALLDEYMQEVAQANSLQPIFGVPDPDDSFRDLLGDFPLEEDLAQQPVPDWQGVEAPYAFAPVTRSQLSNAGAEVAVQEVPTGIRRFSSLSQDRLQFYD